MQSQRASTWDATPQIDFDGACRDYEHASGKLSELMVQQSGLKQAIALRKVDLEVIEARHIADGLPGANEAQRKANLLLLTRADEEYQTTLADQIVDEGDLAKVEATMELHRDARSISKRRMDAAIALWVLEGGAR